MNSIKTKSNQYTLVNGKAIGGVVMYPEMGCWQVVIAWEWPKQAIDSNFALVELVVEATAFTMEQLIDHVADYGRDVTHLKKYRKLFPQLF